MIINYWNTLLELIYKHYILEESKMIKYFVKKERKDQMEEPVYREMTR